MATRRAAIVIAVFPYANFACLVIPANSYWPARAGSDPPTARTRSATTQTRAHARTIAPMPITASPAGRL